MPPNTKGPTIKRSGESVQRVIAEFCDAGWLVIALPADISDRAAFFEAVKSVMPLDPPLIGKCNWDALSDSVWGGLDQLKTDRIAIIWPWIEASDELQIGLDILEDVSLSIADPDLTDGHPKEVTIVIV